jgi:hypothetical protein
MASPLVPARAVVISASLLSSCGASASRACFVFQLNVALLILTNVVDVSQCYLILT